MKRPLLVTAIALTVAAVAAALPTRAGEAGWTKLFNGKDLTGWKVFLDPKKQADPDKIFTVKDGIIHCEGSVNG